MQNNNQPITAIGLMSGTSLDGIDAAVLKTDGKKIYEFGKTVSIEYSNEFRNRIRTAIDEVGRSKVQGSRVKDELSDKLLEHDLTILHYQIIEALNIEADIIGFHGQTIIHKPNEKCLDPLTLDLNPCGFTWQIGDGKLLAELTKTTVVNDFRSSDIKAGGQGAPLVPIFHAAIAEALPKPLAIVNIGGVSNITLLDEGGGISAFDTGTGNALINDVTKKYFSKEFDEDGKIAASGNVNEKVLAEYLSHDYFKKPAPKSLDRNHFSLDLTGDLSPADAIATLTAFTAQSILLATKNTKKFYVAGGGRKNKTIMQMLGNNAQPIENIGHDGDMFEAQAFAYLAVRALRNLPISFPTTTGCKESLLKDIAKIHNI